MEGEIKRGILAIFLSGMWIGASEFLRNELLFKSYWIEHYEKLGLVFPSEMANNMVWALWSFVFAGLIYWATRRMKIWEAIGFMWLAGFVMMWLVTGNLAVLPYGILVFAVPLSIIEVILAAFIVVKIDPKG